MDQLNDLCTGRPGLEQAIEHGLHHCFEQQQAGSQPDTDGHVHPESVSPEAEGLQAVTTHDDVQKQQPENHAAAEQQRPEEKFIEPGYVVPDQVHPDGQGEHWNNSRERGGNLDCGFLLR